MSAPLASTDRDAWLRLLARWGLITAVTVAGLIAVFFSGLAAVSSQPGAGGDYDELLMARSWWRVPVQHGVVMPRPAQT